MNPLAARAWARRSSGITARAYVVQNPALDDRVARCNAEP
jgi:hypothetical protein